MDRTEPPDESATRLPASVFRPLTDADPGNLGPYQPLARIGSGGMGRVYLAAAPDGRAVAVKIVRVELAEDTEFRRRFRQEVAAAQRVQGPFTAPLLDADTDADPPWLATAYVPGPSLQDAVTDHGPLPERSTWTLISGLAQALHTVHDAGVIHRDLKPANVLLAADGPRVIDFGIARATDATTLTRTGIRVGSPQFMSPEQATGAPVTTATDIFAIGALIVFTAAGRTPFGDGAEPAVLYRLVHEPPQLDDLPPALAELAAACLHKDPTARPTTTDILRVCVDHGTPAPGDSAWLPPAIAADIGLREAALPRPHTTEPDEPQSVTDSLPTARATRVQATPEPRRTRRWVTPAAALAVLATATVLTVNLVPRIGTNSHGGPSTDSSSTTRPSTAASEDGSFAALPGDGNGNQLAFSPDGHTLAVARETGAVDVWNVDSQHLTATLPGTGGSANTSVAFSPDGHLLASTRDGLTAVLWDTSSNTEIATLADQHHTSVDSLAFSPDGNVLAVGAAIPSDTSTNDEIQLWDTTNHSLITTLSTGREGIVYAIAYSPDGHTLATGEADGTVNIWDITTRHLISTLTSPPDGVYMLTFSPDGRTLAIANDQDGTTRIWDVETRHLATTLTGNPGDAHAVAFTPDGRTLATVGEDGTVKLWDSATYQQTAILTCYPGGSVSALAFSPNSHILATEGPRGNTAVKLWRIS